MKKIDEIIDSCREQIIESLCESIAIKSVRDAAQPEAPFGAGVKRALDHFLAVARGMGFECGSEEGYYGFVDYGSGEQTLAVLAHLDVVPEGSGWSRDPYGAQVADGKIFGRGAMDDKGPAFAALYALYAIKQAGIVGDRRVRLILGCDEESGCGCIKRYKELEKEPEIAFSPDAEYPVVNSEKGIIHITFEKKYVSKLKVDCGTVANVVPGVAQGFAPVAPEELSASMRKAGIQGEVSPSQGGASFKIVGLSAHASTPEQGKNALQMLLEVLSEQKLGEQDSKIIALLRNNLKYDMHGETLGLSFCDASGSTTLAPSILKIDESGLELTLDLRVPTGLKLEDVKNTLTRAFEGLSIKRAELTEGHFVSPQSELVTKLLAVYSDRMGVKEAKPLAIGGGTYAKAFKNAVAFGCEMPGSMNNIHMPDEFLSIDELMLDTHIMADAILSLMRVD